MTEEENTVEVEEVVEQSEVQAVEDTDEVSPEGEFDTHDDETVVYDEEVVDQKETEEVEVEEGERFTCKLCQVEQVEDEVKDRWYCDICNNNLNQAYQWLQSSMLSASEMKALQGKIHDLTDIEKIQFE